jgi:hypothetical protein
VSRSHQFGRAALRVLALEDRAVPASLTIPLDPAADQLGHQVLTVQEYRGAGGAPQTTLGVFDTGSASVAWDYTNQMDFQWAGGAGLPVKVPYGATLDGVGGPLTGHVAEPGRVAVDGFHALHWDFDPEFGAVTPAVVMGGATAVPGVQSLVGDESASMNLPTLTGTPVLTPTAARPNGSAALVEMQGAVMDFSAWLSDPAFPGQDPPADFVVKFPDLHLVGPNRDLPTVPGSTSPVYVPVKLFGTDNVANPGDDITQAPVPVISGAAAGDGSGSASGLNFLFDTGSQLTLISKAAAESLGLDLANPETTAEVWGAGDFVSEVPGYTLDHLDVPLSDGGTLSFTNVPVYVYDANGATGAVPAALDGLLGMNLFNTADKVLYDPYRTSGPAVGLTFFTTPERWNQDDEDVLFDASWQLGFPFVGSLRGFYTPVLASGGNRAADLGTGGSIAGTVFNDADRDGRRDAGESDQSGAIVYLDLNRSGRLDAADQTAVTGADGRYQFDGLAAGQYQVRVVLGGGAFRTSKAAVYKARVTDGTDVVNRDFGVADPAAVVRRVAATRDARHAATALTVVFSESVSIDPAAFQVVGRGGVPVAATVTTAEVGGHTEVTLTFAVSLAAGRYRLVVKNELVHDSIGQALDGNRDGRPGGDLRLDVAGVLMPAAAPAPRGRLGR